MIQGFGQQITEIPAFGHDITEVRAMGELVWQKQSSIPDYLCFTALESGTFTLTIGSGVSTTNLQYIEYSLDGRNWTKTNNVDSTEIVITTPQVSAGDKVYWRGKGQIMSNSYSTNNFSMFSSTKAGTSDEMSFDASGNVMSLLTDNFSDSMTWSYTTRTFCRLFQYTAIRHAKDMIIPLTHIGYYGCIYMFTSSSIVSAPKMAPTRLGAQALNSMFAHCASLTDISALDFSGVTQFDLYSGYGRNFYVTFSGCSSLTAAPILPTINPVNGTYLNTFTGCTSLTYIKCLATDLSATDAFTNWLSNASTTGTFIQAEGVTWPRGASGIPTGWVDVEKRTMPSGYKQVEYLLNPNLGAFNLQHVFDSANETIELQFVNTADGGQFLGTTNHAGYYGAIKVGKSGTANLSVQIGIGNATTNTSVIGMTADAPMTFRYEGNANGFKFYTNGTLQKSYTGGWDVQHTITVMYVYSNTDDTAAPSTYPTWFGKCPFIGLKVWDGNSDIIIDFVPCIRESDGLAGFYDFARTTFYYSLNGNDFTAGEEI